MSAEELLFLSAAVTNGLFHFQNAICVTWNQITYSRKRISVELLKGQIPEKPLLTNCQWWREQYQGIMSITILLIHCKSVTKIVWPSDTPDPTTVLNTGPTPCVFGKYWRRRRLTLSEASNTMGKERMSQGEAYKDYSLQAAAYCRWVPRDVHAMTVCSWAHCTP